MLRVINIKPYRSFFYFLIPVIFLIICAIPPLKAIAQGQPYSVAALTWNIGNTTAKDEVVRDFVNDIKTHNFPDIIVVGTQEELARNGQKLKDKLLLQLNSIKPNFYSLAGENSYDTAAGANNSAKTAVLVGAQQSPVSSALNLAQNRTILAILIRKGSSFEDKETKIYYPPGTAKSNNGIILIKGSLRKEGNNNQYPLLISVSNVHLNSGSDAKRRGHTNVFLEKEGLSNASKKYSDILKDAKRFHLIMGDFNERDYLMKDSSVIDRGYLTNLAVYGFDFAQPQEKSKVVYGTYGFTKLDNTVPEPLKDPRGRPHNAKGGFLDRITFTSGQNVHSEPQEYGAIIDKAKFDKKKKLFYSGSDHLPIIRHFQIFPSNDREDATITKNYIKQQLPKFEREVRDIDLLMQNRANVNKMTFYDSPDTAENYWRQLSGQELKQKKEDLLGLQEKINVLKTLIDESIDNGFLEAVYNKITFCNKKRTDTLEKMDASESAKINWYFPGSLGQNDFKNYTYAINNLVKVNLQKPSSQR